MSIVPNPSFASDVETYLANLFQVNSKKAASNKKQKRKTILFRGLEIPSFIASSIPRPIGKKTSWMQCVIQMAKHWFVTDKDSVGSVEEHLARTLVELHACLCNWRVEYLLRPSIVYAQRYMKMLGEVIHSSFIFELFLTSVVITVKFWHDSVISTGTFASIFDRPIERMRSNEKNFLYVVDWDLCLTEHEIRGFEKKLLFQTL